MSDAPKPPPFNPTWVSVCLVVLTGVISGSVSTALNARDAADFRDFKADQQRWNAVMEKRFADEQLATGKTLVALSKDVETANKTLTSIQQALMVRPAQVSQSTP